MLPPLNIRRSLIPLDNCAEIQIQWATSYADESLTSILLQEVVDVAEEFLVVILALVNWTTTLFLSPSTSSTDRQVRPERIHKPDLCWSCTRAISVPCAIIISATRWRRINPGEPPGFSPRPLGCLLPTQCRRNKCGRFFLQISELGSDADCCRWSLRWRTGRSNGRPS